MLYIPLGIHKCSQTLSSICRWLRAHAHEIKICSTLISGHGGIVNELTLMFLSLEQRRKHHQKNTFHSTFRKVKYYCLYLFFSFSVFHTHCCFSFFQGMSDEAAKVVYQMKRATSVGQREAKAAVLESWAWRWPYCQTGVTNMTNITNKQNKKKIKLCILVRE